MAKKTRDILFLIFFMAIVGYAFWTFFSVSALSNGKLMDEMFFRHGEDHFMDFFNSIRDDREVNGISDYWTVYPPIMSSMFMWIANFIPAKYLSRDPNVHYLIQQSAAAIFAYFVFCLISFTILFVSGNEILKGKSPLEKIIAFIAVALCYPLAYAFERGQVLLLSIALMVYFFAFSESKSPWKRETAYIALGFSAVIKVYPLMFLFVLLRRRDWWGFLKSGIYAILVLMIPFVIYHGAEGFFYWYRNVIGFAITTDAFTGLESLEFPLWALPIAGVAFLILLFSQKRDWETYLMLCGLMYIVSKSRSTYSFCYYIPMVFLLFKEEKDAGSFGAFFISALVLYSFWGFSNGEIIKNYHDLVEVAFKVSVLIAPMQFVTRLVWIDLAKENIWSRDYRRSIFRPRLPILR